MRPALDIVLPCFNPSDDWTQTILRSCDKIKALLPEVNLTLIVVNDGSTTDILQDIKKLKETILQVKIESYPENKGKGFAVRKGVELSQGEIVIYTDIDFPYEEVDLVKLYFALAGGNCDVAFGTRDDNYYNNVPAARKLISRFLKQIIQIALKVPTTDTQAGLKGFNQKGKTVFLQTTINRYLFDLEFVYLTGKRKDVRTQCVTVRVKPDVRFSRMNWKALLGEAVNFFKILVD